MPDSAASEAASSAHMPHVRKIDFAEPPHKAEAEIIAKDSIPKRPRVMTKIAELAARSRAAGVRLQELDDALLALVPVEAREKVRLAMRLKAQFTEFQHAVADAVEWCERRERESGDDLWTIIERAASEFRVSAKAIERGWIEHNQQALNDLLQLRVAARQLNESV